MKKTREVSNWCLISFPGYLIAYAGAAINIKAIGFIGLALMIIGAIIWIVTSPPAEKRIEKVK